MQQKILQAVQASATGGHTGIHATCNRLWRLFAWPDMGKVVVKFVCDCNICKEAKTERVHAPGLLELLHVPPHAWHMITLDFVEGLPLSRDYSCIMVVVDKLTRYAHFIPLAHPFSAIQVVNAFMTNIYKLHGLPYAMVSNRDRVFTSTLWKELFKQAGMELRTSSSYHPQTDGTTERVNQCMVTYLRCFVHCCPQRWFQWIHLAEFWYNTASHSVLCSSPFEVLYGQPLFILGSMMLLPWHHWIYLRGSKSGK
ncbi:putative polyprotein [Hordeum vulgare]|nr:putative polyprotein [Hordeum vulgare]